jgi:hypothetical protein
MNAMDVREYYSCQAPWQAGAGVGAGRRPVIDDPSAELERWKRDANGVNMQERKEKKAPYRASSLHRIANDHECHETSFQLVDSSSGLSESTVVELIAWWRPTSRTTVYTQHA